MSNLILTESMLASLKRIPFIEDLYCVSRDLEKEVYLVGGIVRDLILGKMKGGEIDIAVEEDERDFGLALAKRIQGSFFFLDKERSLSRVVMKREEGMIQIDIAGFKKNRIEDDLLLRDFTVNSLALRLKDIFEEEQVCFIDPSGGMKDIQDRIVRLKDERALEDDPLRLLRGVRFLTSGFHLEEKTEGLIQTKAGLIRTVSPERIRDELFKIFLFSRSSHVIKKLYELGLLESLFPEIKSLSNTSLRREEKYSLWDHSLITLAFLEEVFLNLEPLFPAHSHWLGTHLEERLEADISRREIAKFCALFHDIGKPQAMIRDDFGNIRFFDHETVGAKIGEEIAFSLRMSHRSTECIRKIIMHHLRPLHMSKSKKLSERAFYRFFRDIGEEGFAVCLIALADAGATLELEKDRKDTNVKEIVDKLFDYYFNKYISLEKKPLIKGKDLIDCYGLKPGPLLGEILREVEEARGAGIINNKDEAKKYIEDLFDISPKKG